MGGFGLWGEGWWVRVGGARFLTVELIIVYDSML